MRRTASAVLAIAAVAAWTALAAGSGTGCAPAPGSGGPGVGPAGDEPPPPGRIVLYVQDTLRADVLGAYGEIFPTSPHLDALCREAVRFERCVSPTGWTRPAIATLLTGLPPLAHGVRRRDHALGDGLPVVPERLAAAGWRSLCVMTNPNGWSDWGFDRGFDRWEERDPFAVEGRAPAAGAARAAMVADLASDTDDPIFEYVHTTDPHWPYRPGPRDRATFVPEMTVDGIIELTGAEQDVDEGDVEQMIALYRGEVAGNDRALGDLVRALKDEGVWDDTLLIVTSDHGEEFGDHGTYFHGHTLFEELVRVPLVVRWPRGWNGGLTVTEPVALEDVTATILNAAGAEPLGFGEDLAAHANRAAARAARAADGAGGPADAGADDTGPGREDDDAAPRTFFLDLALDEHEVRGVSRGRWKYLRRESPIRAHALYDLSTDPGERANVLTAHPEVVDALVADLDAWRARFDAGLHLAFVHPEGDEAPRRWQGVLRCEGGRITGLRVRSLEDDDTAVYDAGTGTVTVDLRTGLRADPVKIGPHGGGLLPDEDELIVQVAPAGARLVADLRVDGTVEPPTVWQPDGEPRGTLGPDVLPASDDPALRPAAGSALGRAARREHPGLWVWLVPPPPARRLEEIDPEMERRLEALGY